MRERLVGAVLGVACALSLAFARAQERDVDVLAVDGVTGPPVANAEICWSVPALDVGQLGMSLADINGFGSSDPDATDRYARASGCSNAELRLRRTVR